MTNKINIGLRNQKNSPKEVLDLIKENKIIPQDIFSKYSLNYNSKHIVGFKCEMCGKYEESVWNILNNRIDLYNKICCKKCSYIYSTCIRESISEDLIQYYFNNLPVPFDKYIKNKENNSNKLYIKIKCEQCNQEKYVKWGKFKNRKYCNDIQICNDCVKKYTSNLEQVKINNSKAQTICQNREDVKIKQSIASKNRSEDYKIKWKNSIDKFYNSDEGKKCKEKKSILSKNLWANNENFKYRCTNVKTLHGKIYGIRFDSSWELSFILYCVNNDIKINRCNINIPYKYDGKDKIYIPDFIIDNKYIIEIKGKLDEVSKIKMQSAKKYLKGNNMDYEYILLTKNELSKINNFVFLKNKRDLSKISNLELSYIPNNFK